MYTVHVSEKINSMLFSLASVHCKLWSLILSINALMLFSLFFSLQPLPFDPIVFFYIRAALKIVAATLAARLNI